MFSKRLGAALVAAWKAYGTRGRERSTPEETIAIATRVLKENRVAENLEELLNCTPGPLRDIQIDTIKSASGSELDRHVQGKIQQQCNLTYGEPKVSLQVVVHGVSHSSLPDGEPYSSARLTVFHNGDCVLEARIHQNNRDEYSFGNTYRVSLHPSSMNALKLGGWVEELKLVMERVRRHKLEAAKVARRESERDTARKIELGKFDRRE